MTKVDGSSIGERIRMIRQAKSLTQEELASRAGLTKGFISQVERNITSLSRQRVFSVSSMPSIRRPRRFLTKDLRKDRIRERRQG